MANNFRHLLLQAPEASVDGSGVVKHDIQAEYENGGWEIVAGRHKDVCIPADALDTVLAMPDGAEKVAAYKNLLKDNLNTQPVPATGWSEAQMQAFIDANDEALQVSVDANEYILTVKPSGYPVPFNI